MLDSTTATPPLRLRDKRYLGWAVPYGIYLAFVITANLIGNKYSCKPVANVYYLGGFLSLPLLFAAPIFFLRPLHLAKRLLLGLMHVAVGVGIWIWAYEAAGMYFMCRLF